MDRVRLWDSAVGCVMCVHGSGSGLGPGLCEASWNEVSFTARVRVVCGPLARSLAVPGPIPYSICMPGGHDPVVQ